MGWRADSATCSREGCRTDDDLQLEGRGRRAGGDVETPRNAGGYAGRVAGTFWRGEVKCVGRGEARRERDTSPERYAGNSAINTNIFQGEGAVLTIRYPTTQHPLLRCPSSAVAVPFCGRARLAARPSSSCSGFFALYSLVAAFSEPADASCCCEGGEGLIGSPSRL